MAEILSRVCCGECLLDGIWLLHLFIPSYNLNAIIG